MSKSIELSEIIREMREVKQRLDKSSKEIFNLAKNKAYAEKAYKIALRAEILKLKTEGYPATLINDLARGNEQIADLRYQRDMSEEVYKSGLEAMKTIRTEASILQTISKYQDE